MYTYRHSSPLNVIFSGLDVLRSGIGVSEGNLTLLDEMYTSTLATIEILNNLLDYEHVTFGTNTYFLHTYIHTYKLIRNVGV